MSEGNIESIIRDFREAIEKGNVEKTLSFLTEDVVWVVPEGTFRGKEEVKRLLNWWAQVSKTRFKDTGIGIMVKGNKAVYEYVVEAESREGKYETLGICIYEFKNEKIQSHRVLYDRLSAAKQSAKGVVAQRVVNTVVNRWEKGLH